jgi:hypothetical protein
MPTTETLRLFRVVQSESNVGIWLMKCIGVAIIWSFCFLLVLLAQKSETIAVLGTLLWIVVVVGDGTTAVGFVAMVARCWTSGEHRGVF